MDIKLNFKQALLAFARLLSPVTGERFGMQILWRKLLDERVLPREYVLRPLRLSGVEVLCNPYVYTHRSVYWTGRLYDRPLEKYLRRTLRHGDTLIDVGMNLGHVTSLAASLVGTEGRVHAFEVNSRLAKRVEKVLMEQGLSQVSVFPIGLGEEASEMQLQVSSEEAGTNTMLMHTEASTLQTKQMTVTIEAGDTLLSRVSKPGRVLLKVDVEGFERQVLRGLCGVITSFVHSAVVEVTPEWLGGETGVEELFEVMQECGLTGFELTEQGTAGSPLFARDIGNEQCNVLFVRNEDHANG